MLPWLASETVVRLRGDVGSDGYGGTAVDWSGEPDRLSVPGCSVQPMAGAEVVDGRDAVTSRWTLYAPDTADISSLDRVEYRGVAYDVDGSVQLWVDPTGAGLDHKVAVLRRGDG